MKQDTFTYRVDVNCDMAEGVGNEALLMPYISSANIACGAHAGDETEMKKVAALCVQHRVAIGAHPSFYDRENFGRTNMVLPPQQVYDLVCEQVWRLRQLTVEMGTVLHHVKPHGALYNMAAKDAALADAVCRAVQAVDGNLQLYGLSQSALTAAAVACGLKAVHEVFADRTYQPDGSLTPRSMPGALITDAEAAAAQVLQMVTRQTVTGVTGATVAVQADTVCIHGDGAHATEFARHIYRTLQQKQILVQHG